MRLNIFKTCQSQGDITPRMYSDMQKILPGTTCLSVNELVYTETVFGMVIYLSLTGIFFKDTKLKKLINAKFNTFKFKCK